MAIEEQAGDQTDRREFFRIDDSIQLSYRIVDSVELSLRLEKLDNSVSSSFTVMTRLQALSQHLSASLHRIEQKDPDVADYLKALDKKVELLGQSFLADEIDLTEQPAKPINLSAGGMSLCATESLEISTQLEIKMLLLPSFTGVLIYGEVVGSEAVPDDADFPWNLRVNFSHIRDADRDALIRHILRRQAAVLRQQREDRERLEDE